MELTAVEPQRPRRRFWLQFILLLCFLTCLILGIGSLSALLMLRSARLPVNDTTTRIAVEPAEVVPTLALNLLAGDPADALVLQSATAGEIETAWAILAFDTTMSEENKAVFYSLLSKRLTQSSASTREIRERIQAIQRLARATIVLSPAIDSSIQGQVLAQSVKDLLAVEAKEDALLSATNLQRLGERTPDLLPVQRRQLMEPLNPHVKALNAPDFEQRLAELLRNPFLDSAGALLPQQLSNMVIEPAYDDALTSAITTRKEAARLLSQTGANDPNGVAKLSEALLLEEAVRRQITEPILGDSSRLAGERLGILFDRYQWTALKAQVAAGGFGISIVPEWEANWGTIESELNTTVQAIDQAIDQLMETLPEAKDKAALRVEKFLWLGLQTERGLFPGGSLALLSNDLRFAQTELEIQGTILALPVFWNTGLEDPEFMFQPAGQ